MNQKEQLIIRILSQDAYQRYNRIKEYHKEKIVKIDNLLYNMYYSGKIQSIISDDDFVKLISQIEDDKKPIEIKINRRRGDFDLDD
ncbi:Programmed cell death protein 5 [Conglomerata obtusa]